MKLLPISCFFSYFIFCAAVPVPDIGVDCDDPNIFKAVDVALRNYNEAKEDGNQFLLFRVTDAKQTNYANGKIHYFLEYEIREGSCPVKSKHSWQDCQFQENKPERGKCSAHLLINKEENIHIVESQNCSISQEPLESHVTAIHHQCLGCPYPVDTNNEEILHYVHIAIETMNRKGPHLYYFDLVQIVKATSQVVSGWNYNIHYVVRKTNCSKIDFKTKDSNECKLDKEGETGDCELQVSKTPNGQINDMIMTCTSQAGVCLSCPLNVALDDPELLNLLSQVVDEYNSNANVTVLHKLHSVVTATKHGFQEQIYEVLFSMMPTTCTKPEHTMLGDECDNVENAFPLSCDITINVSDKRINAHSAPDCVEQRVFALIKRITGLSPLRMLKRTNQTENNLHLSNSTENQEYAKGMKKGHNKGHKQEEEKEVESGINVNIKEASHQVVQRKQTAAKYVGDTPKQELPDVPKCPGKLWQPISLTTTVKPLTDDELAFAIDDIKPLPDKEEEQSNPHIPKEIPEFNDEDLLI